MGSFREDWMFHTESADLVMLPLIPVDQDSCHAIDRQLQETTKALRWLKKKTKRKFSWYILAKGVFVTKSGMKYGEGPAFMWEESKMWFDLLTEDVDGMFVIVLKTIWYITFEASKCLGFWNFYLLGRPWLKQRHQRRSTRTCVKGRHRENMGFPSGSAEPLGWLKMRGKGMVILSRSLRSGSPKNRRF